jgi:competence protein ComEA
MLKKLLVTVAMMATMTFAFAEVDVNKADQAALDSVRGIGPSMSKTILDERKKNGNFKDWEDLQARVKGVGDKSSEKFSQAGLTVNGASKPGVKASAKKEATIASAKPKAEELKK